MSSGLSQQPLARACSTCQKAKCKCKFEDNQATKCERCQRLQKTCEPALIRVRAKRKSNSDRKMRVENLEAKLDGLVSLLQASHQVSLPMRISTSSGLGMTSGSSSSAAHSYKDTNMQQLPITGRASDRGSLDTGSPETVGPSYPIDFHITGEEDPDVLLDTFRNEIHPWFPFVKLDALSAVQLFQDRPFLYLTVITVATHNTARRAKLVDLVMKHLSTRVLIEDERSMDLLLGVLVFTGWTMTNFWNNPRFTSLISIASTLVGDLRVAQPPFDKDPYSLLAAIRISCGKSALMPAFNSTDDKRAYLGYFLLASTVATFFGKLTPPRWTSYTEDSCRILSESGVESDQHLVTLIRIQVMLETIPKSHWHTLPEPVSLPSPTTYCKMLEEQLLHFKNQLQQGIMDQVSVKLSCLNVEIAIHRIGLAKSTMTSTFDAQAPERLTMLHMCLQAIKKFLDIFLTIKVRDYQGIPMMIYAQLTNALGTYYLLSTYDCPGWSLTSVNQAIDIARFLRILSDNCFQVKLTLGYDAHTSDRVDDFSQLAQKYRFFATWFEQQVPAQQSEIANRTGHSHGDGKIEDPSYTMDYFESLDNVWMTDMLGDWEEVASL